jgi:hypothetical protein
MLVQLSWRQHVLLSAASQVDYLDLRTTRQTNITHGVWRSLVIRGLMREIPGGWEITDMGRWTLKVGVITEPKQRTERLLMDGKLPRYAVSRTLDGWVVIDRHISKIRMYNDVVEMLRSRNAARIRARELNLAEIRAAKEAAA